MKENKHQQPPSGLLSELSRLEKMSIKTWRKLIKQSGKWLKIASHFSNGRCAIYLEEYADIDATAWDILKVNEISYKLNSEDALKILLKHYDECGSYLDEHLSGSDIVKLIKERGIEHSFPPLKRVENIIEIARQIPDYIPEIPEYVWEKFNEPYLTHGMGPGLSGYLLALAPASLHVVKKMHSLDQFSVCDWLFWLENHPKPKEFIEKEVEREAENCPTYEIAKAMMGITRFEDVKSWDRLTPMDWVDLMYFNTDIFQKIMHERKVLHKFSANEWIEVLECDETFAEEIPEDVWKELPDRVWEFLLKKKSKIAKRNLKFRKKTLSAQKYKKSLQKNK